MDIFDAAWRVADAIRARKLSAREAVDETLARLDARNPALNAFIFADPEGARRQAAAIDDAVARGLDPGPLGGVPIGVKDLEAVAGMPLTFGSRAFRDNVAAEDSVQVARLRAAGAIVALATAGDGGGSIRIPAAFSGCYGIKPSAGRIPRAAANAPTWGTHSTLGPVSRTVRDAARYLDAAAGPHPNDLDSLDAPPGVYEAAVLAPPPKLGRVAWSPDLGYAVTEPGVARLAAAAARALAEAVGAELVEASPGFADPMAAWYTMAAPGDVRLIDGMTAEQKAELEKGFVLFAEQARAIMGVDIANALEARHQLNRTMTAFFEDYDLLLTPTVACTAFAAEGPPPAAIGGREVGPAGYLPFTPPFNVTGHPAASLPAGLAADGLPVGLQVVAPRHADALLLAVSAAYEAANPWPWPA